MAQADEAATGVVLSGGGAYAAYQVGVLKALCAGRSSSTDHQPLRARIFVGTSAGAVNAAGIVAHPGLDLANATNQLEQLWIDRLAGDRRRGRAGAIRVRGDLAEYANPAAVSSNPLGALGLLAGDSMFFARDLLSRALRFVASTEPLGRRVVMLADLFPLIATEEFQRIIAEFIDLEEIRRSDRILRLTATNWRTGESKLFKNQEMTDANGHLMIMASAAFPGIPPVVVAGEPYVDGGYVLDTPLAPAVHAGATTVFVIYMAPQISVMPLRGSYSTLDILDTLYHANMAMLIGRDMHMLADINRGIALLASVTDPQRVTSDDVRAALRFLGHVQETAGDTRFFDQLTIHSFHPREDLGGSLGLMNVDRDQIMRLIQRGFDDAVGHDCKLNNCVLPDLTGPQSATSKG
jgi:predicted acylesterase/phospholipase RssA